MFQVKLCMRNEKKFICTTVYHSLRAYKKKQEKFSDPGFCGFKGLRRKKKQVLKNLPRLSDIKIAEWLFHFQQSQSVV